MLENFIKILDIIGAIAFAYSGVNIAIKHKMDFLGVILLGCITVVGGGILRDILIGNYPISIFKDYTEIITASITSVILFILFYIKKDMTFFDKRWFNTLNVILDAIGLGVFVIMGEKVAFDLAKNPNDEWFKIILLGTITATGGGVLRDLLSLRIPMIFSKHIYAVAAIIEAIIYYIMHINNVSIYFNTIFNICLVVLIRYLAYRFEINLPRVRLKNEE